MSVATEGDTIGAGAGQAPPAKRRGGRPKGSKSAPPVERAVRQLVRTVLDVFENGVPAVGSDGRPLVDKVTGKVIRRAPTASWLSASRALLRDLGALDVVRDELAAAAGGPGRPGRRRKGSRAGFGIRERVERLKAEGKLNLDGPRQPTQAGPAEPASEMTVEQTEARIAQLEAEKAKLIQERDEPARQQALQIALQQTIDERGGR